MSIESLESASSFWAISSLVLTGVLAISGALAWYFSDQAGAAKDERLKREIASATTRGAEANEKAAKANERAAVLEKQAADTLLKYETLKSNVAWRSIPEATLKELTQELAKQPSSLVLRRVDNDPEALFLAIQIEKAFDDAKWRVQNESVTLAGQLAFGVFIHGPTEPNAGPEATRVREIFTALKLQFGIDHLTLGTALGSMDPSFSPKVIITVGSKHRSL